MEADGIVIGVISAAVLIPLGIAAFFAKKWIDGLENRIDKKIDVLEERIDLLKNELHAAKTEFGAEKSVEDDKKWSMLLSAVLYPEETRKSLDEGSGQNLSAADQEISSTQRTPG